MNDAEVPHLIDLERKRQAEQLQLIPSENYVSKDVLEAVGSVVINKYSEGQIGKRYYQGNQYLDEIEQLAKNNALKLFKLDPKEWSVNVQPYNGSLANLAVFTALLNLGDKIMSMYLYDGGHLSHGWKLDKDKPVSFSGRLYNSVFYHVSKETEMFDYDQIAAQARKEKPQLIISGGTGYPREINYKRMAQIAHVADALYLADVAHEAGLIAGGVLTSPFEHADIVTMTTRKTLRGPIGALIFSRAYLAERIDRAVFPGLQGGPPNHQIAGVAVALGEALKPEFKAYAQQVVRNAQALAESLVKEGFRLVSGGTDKHLMLLDLRNQGLDGWCAAWALEAAGIIVNRSTIPFDTGTPYYPSGLRLGTPAVTTRGMKEKEMGIIAQYIKDSIETSGEYGEIPHAEFKKRVFQDRVLRNIKDQVRNLCAQFPIP